MYQAGDIKNLVEVIWGSQNLNPGSLAFGTYFRQGFIHPVSVY